MGAAVGFDAEHFALTPFLIAKGFTPLPQERGLKALILRITPPSPAGEGGWEDEGLDSVKLTLKQIICLPL